MDLTPGIYRSSRFSNKSSEHTSKIYGSISKGSISAGQSKLKSYRHLVNYRKRSAIRSSSDIDTQKNTLLALEPKQLAMLPL